jgi:hypothetical protein
MIQAGIEEGGLSAGAEGTPPRRGETKAMIKPVSIREGRAARPGIRSFWPGGPIPHSENRFFCNRRYQTRASEGILYRKIRASSPALEKTAGPSTGAWPMEPDRKSTTYRIRVSIRAFIFPSASPITVFILQLYTRTAD